ncbi:MAG TPA: hypothetical protein PK205_12090 [Promineifilum sp.]|nr:hypothetical protein [Promineifilum sp.]
MLNDMADHYGLTADKMKAAVFQCIRRPTLITANATVNKLRFVGKSDLQGGGYDIGRLRFSLRVDEKTQPGSDRATTNIHERCQFIALAQHPSFALAINRQRLYSLDQTRDRIGIQELNIPFIGRDTTR